MSEVVGVEDDVERAGNKSEEPDQKQAANDGQSAVGTLPFGEPRKDEIEEPLGGHGPGGRVEEGGNLWNPALQEKGRKDHREPEHVMRVLAVFGGDGAPREGE